jgi:hypothetical protein
MNIVRSEIGVGSNGVIGYLGCENESGPPDGTGRDEAF